MKLRRNICQVPINLADVGRVPPVSGPPITTALANRGFLVRTLRNLHCAALSAVFHTCILGNCSRLTDGIAKAPKGGWALICGYRSAIAVEPNCDFAVFGVLGAILHGDTFCFCPAAPLIRLAPSSGGAAIGDSTIAFGWSGWRRAGLHVFDALTFFISAAGSGANLRLCRRGSQDRRRQNCQANCVLHGSPICNQRDTRRANLPAFQPFVTLGVSRSRQISFRIDQYFLAGQLLPWDVRQCARRAAVRS